MAQPIELKLPPRDPRRELAERLEQAPVEYAAAILDSFELLQELHKSGSFVLARGLLSAKDKVLEDVSAGANRADTTRALRNAIILAKMLASIDPELLDGISLSVAETFGNKKAIPSRPPGLFAMLFGFTSPDHRRGLALILRLFKKIGCRLNTQTSECGELR